MDSSFYSVFVLALAIQTGIGAAIDGQRGALWGFFLGPVGWILAAILKGKIPNAGGLENQSRNANVAQIHQDLPRGAEARTGVGGTNEAKWAVLKQVDPDIRIAAERVSAVDPRLEFVLAEKYLVLSEKAYLAPMVELVLRDHQARLDLAENEASRFAADVLESGRKQKEDYMRGLGADGYDPNIKARVVGVEIYDGSWVGWKGGIRITFDDGRNVLKNGAMRRDFPAGNDKWK